VERRDTRIKRLLEELGWTQVMLAEFLSIVTGRQYGQTLVAQWATGTRQPQPPAADWLIALELAVEHKKSGWI